MAKALFVGGLHRTIKWLCLVLVLLTYLLIYVIQHSIIKNVTVIPNGRLKQQQQTLLSSFKTTTTSEDDDNSALEKAESYGSGGVSTSQLVVGSTLETWFRTNLNVTLCDSATALTIPSWLTIGRNKDQQQHEQQQQRRAANTAAKNQQPLLQQQKRPFWQPLEPKVLLHSAFMDDRTMFQNVKYRFVRILALKQGRDVTTTFYCHLIPRTLKLQQPQSYPLPESAAAVEAVVLTNTSTTTTSNQTTTTTVIAAVMATYHEIWVAAWHPNPPKDQFHSIMIHCPIPLDVNSSELEGVLISQNKSCDLSSSSASSMLPIENGEEINGAVEEEENVNDNDVVKKDFCVCVKPLDFPGDPRLATRLIEWIESMILLGAQKIVIYLYSGIY